MKIRLSQISYLNTLPFDYALENADFLKDKSIITKDFPAECARKLTNSEADIGLIPVAALPDLPNYKIITDYCISCDGEVATVNLFSDVPLNEIDRIYLDYQSRTSVLLIKLLAKNFWDINFEWLESYPGFENDIKAKTAGLIIGDRCFEKTNQHKFVYDLGNEWKKFTGLPFVFAVWVSTKELSKEILEDFNTIFRKSIENVDKIVETKPTGAISKETMANYLKNNIQYNINEEKKIAISEFFRMLEIQHKPVF
ncbi:MAG: menaquinone biosynthesis protein [Bacteroidales bacterium]|nr:menaquinone biosynthesis protein [Bacteroidales bacterium]